MNHFEEWRHDTLKEIIKVGKSHESPDGFKVCKDVIIEAMLQHELDLIKPEETKYQFLEFNRIIKEVMDIAQPELNDRICSYFKLLQIVSLESTCLMIK